MRSHIFRRFALVLSLFAASVALGATLTVTNNSDAGAGSLRAALADAGDGDTIVFALLTGNETIVIQSELSISGKSLTIDGSNPTAGGSGTPVTIQVPIPGSSPYRVFNLTPGSGHTVTLRHLTLRGGNVHGLEGGVILCTTGTIAWIR
jgi:hypothetical protein